jgi:hypothetical protein
MKWVLRAIRFSAVTVGIVVLTSLGIDASQYLTGSQSALGILVDKATTGECPLGMVRVSNSDRSFCIDAYEAKVGDGCPRAAPATSDETAANIAVGTCSPQSVQDGEPWINVSFHQAKELCARAGKRLPTNEEWYRAALGTPSNSCAIKSSGVQKSATNDCVSGVGAYDMVGNAWEWVDASVSDGLYSEVTLPSEGYVANADTAGMPTQTAAAPNQTFGSDYFWADPQGSYVMMRGGFYGSGEDAGLYAVHSKVDAAFSGNAISFRCVQ